jgi:hypothetical protein
MRGVGIAKAFMLSGVALAAVNTNAYASKSLETSLLNTKQSHRSKFGSQPNLDKGEMNMPVEASIIYIIKQTLPDFLSQLASRNNLDLTLSESVTGTLNKISLPMQTELILEELSSSFGFEWHMQGNHLYVSNSLENTNRLINLGKLNLFQLKQLIANSGLNPGANKMTYLSDKNAITLIGSTMYISRVEALIKEHQNTSDIN